MPSELSRYRGIPGGYATVMALTLVVQLVLVSISFPLGELFTATPLLHIDAAHHWYEIHLAVELAQQGKLVGYDPFFAAGYMGGVPFNTSARLPALIAALFGPMVSPALAFKLFSFGCAVAGPAAIPAAARALGLRPGVGAVAGLLALLLWWASPVHWYHTAGIVAWPFVVFGAAWFAATAAEFVCGKGGVGTFLMLALCGAVLFLVHPLFPLAAGLALLPLLFALRRDLIPRRLPALVVALPLLCIALNLPWILATVQHPGMADGMQPYQQVVDINMVWRDMLGLPSAGRGSKLYFVLVFLAIWGAFASPKGREKYLAVALLVGGIGTVVFAAIGSAIPALAVVQTNRFSFQGYVLLLIPAALGALQIGRAAVGAGVTRYMAVPSAAFGLLALVFFVNEVRLELTPGRTAYYGDAPPEVRGIGPLSNWALDQLRTQTDPGARVMFEQSNARVHDGAHMAGYLAVQSSREFIGGAYPHMHFANFWDNWMFGRTADGLPAERFREYLALYNVGWMLVFSDRVKRTMAGMPEISLVAQQGPLALYRVNLPHSFFIQGAGEVTGRATNRLDLANLEGDTIVLKYHFVPGMVTEPPTQVDGIQMLDDPQPFIRIRRPPRSLRLTGP